MNIPKLFLPLVGFAAFALPPALAAGFAVSADHANGLYQSGDTVRWQIRWDGDTVAPSAQFRVLRGWRTEVLHGDLKLADNTAGVGAKFEGPGTLQIDVSWTGADGKTVHATGGAVASANQIALSTPRPDDFDAFWKAKLAELAAVPANPVLEAVDVGNPKITYSKITLANIRGTHIQGQLARPAQGEKFPALLVPQWAGVYALQKSWVTDRANDGWLVLNIQAHDIAIDGPESYFKDLSSNGALKEYWNLGNDDREQSHYLRMYLSCYRAAEYLASRPDWDGRTLVVMGGSQGGQQTLVTAGLHPKVTAALANVPAGCDMLGPVVGRKGGWPQWYDNANGKDAAKVHEASRYFDVANFTPNIHCPILVGVGLRDETCPAEGIFAALNQVKSPKEIVPLPLGAHQNENGSHGPYETRVWTAWLPALRDGKPAPVAP